MPKTKSQAADLTIVEERIAQATEFNVHLRLSPTVKHNERASSLAQAAGIAQQMALLSKQGRKPIIYAIGADSISTPVPQSMVDAALQSDSMDDRLMADAIAEAAEVAPEPAVAEPKPAKAAREPGKRAQAIESAKAGNLPEPPNFAAETHKRFRPKLDELIAMAKAGDVAGLKAAKINPISSSPKALAKYRDLAVIALEARA
jgi:hypothetical protein